MSVATVGRRGRRGGDYKTLGKTLINSKGEVSVENVQEYIRDIRNNPELSKAEKISLENKFKAFIEDRSGNRVEFNKYGQVQTNTYAIKNGKVKPFKPTETNSFEGYIADGVIKKLFANAGLDYAEEAARLGEDLEHFLDEEHWLNNKYYSSTGDIYEVQFNYSGSILHWVG